MAETTADTDIASARSRKTPFIIGVIGAVILGGTGFALAYKGILPFPGAAAETTAEVSPTPLPEVDFIALDPLTISIGPVSEGRHLRFAAQIEARRPHVDEVRAMQPRILDVLNSYLRAVDIADLESPSTLPKLKAQMLRRVQIVCGEGRVNDLLISEFLMN